MPAQKVSSVRPKMSLTTKTTLIFTALALIPALITTLFFLVVYGRQIKDSPVLLVLIVAINVIYIILASWAASRYLLSPILQLYQASFFLKKGDFTHRLNIKSGDEIEELADTFNAIAGNLTQVFQRLNQERAVMLNQSSKAEAVLSTIPDAVIAVDLNRNINFFNKAAENLTGFNSNQVMGQPLGSVIKIYDKKDEISPLTYCPVSTANADSLLFSRDNLELNAGQKQAFINLISRQIKGGASHNLGCIMTIHDVTRERQLEAMKMDFVSMAAHELRTPLTSIKGYLSVFIQENEHKFNQDQMMFLQRIGLSTQQLLNLVENLLNVSRVERGTFSVFRQPLDWIDLVKHSVNDLTNRAKEKKVNLIYADNGLQHLSVEADKLKIVEVLNNLIANAINYTHAGGTIWVWVEVNNQEAITHIKDTGIGIPREAIPHLFSKFFRAHDKLEMVKGTGLGLYISKAIVELHHGKIWVNSEQGKGSVFSFSLPISTHNF